jgi:L-seryl-tRNA(Ser) seleniumtransferase
MTRGGRDHPPSVDALARSLAGTGLPHPLLVDAARAAIAAGDPDGARAVAERFATTLLQPVVNATGVLLHTNLGRAPLGVTLPERYSNLEFDLATGRRGGRRAHAAGVLAKLVGAEACLVVNNGAAAVLLACTALASGARVAVSRGEIVEIGGGFRIHEVLAASGAELVEVGTTNRTRIEDYAAVSGSAALVLKVHPSNYRVVGFASAVPLDALAALGPPVLYDIGSGLLDARTPWLPAPPEWLADEPAARQAIEHGAALVTFSGDKLLGGPQAGIIAGRADLIEECARHPLYRAVRPGGTVLAALESVALAYLARDLDALPFWRMATTPTEALEERARALGVGEVVATASVAGGGALPGAEIPSFGVALPGDRSAHLRAESPPVIVRVRDGHTIADLRTVDPSDDKHLGAALERAARSA